MSKLFLILMLTLNYVDGKETMNSLQAKMETSKGDILIELEFIKTP